MISGKVREWYYAGKLGKRIIVMWILIGTLAMILSYRFRRYPEGLPSMNVGQVVLIDGKRAYVVQPSAKAEGLLIRLPDKSNNFIKGAWIPATKIQKKQ